MWMLRYRVTQADGRRVENALPVGLVRDFPKEKDAWREVDRLGLLLRINDDSADVRIRFDALAEFYLKTDFGPDALRPKTERTTLNTEHIVRGYLVPEWGKEIADDIKPLDIQRWLKSLQTVNGLAWTTISKFRGTMLRIYRIGALHELVATNPLHRILVLTCAATALRFSELLSLRWADVQWEESRIAITKRWSRGKDGPTKTRKSEGHVPLHPILAVYLKEWRDHAPYAKDGDFLFPSLKAEGRVPLSPAVFVADHLRPAAKAAGIALEDGQRFGMHNLRHSLSSWLVNKGKVEPKTVQSILRHSRIQTTLDLYTQGDGDETRAAQGAFLKELALPADWGLSCGLEKSGGMPVNP